MFANHKQLWWSHGSFSMVLITTDVHIDTSLARLRLAIPFQALRLLVTHLVRITKSKTYNLMVSKQIWASDVDVPNYL